MHELTIPTLNANDESYVLVEWLFAESARVTAGQPVAVIETSKAISDLVAEQDGYLHQRLAAGAACAPGEVIGWIGVSPAGGGQRAGVKASGSSAGNGGYDRSPGVVVSRAARELMSELGIPVSAVATLGKPFVRRQDIVALAAQQDEEDDAGEPDDASEPPSQVKEPVTDDSPGQADTPARDDQEASAGVPLSAHQQAVARVVSASHAVIAAAFAVMKVRADELIAAQAHTGSTARAFVGIPEFVIRAVADLADTHAGFFAAVRDGLRLEAVREVDVGVTIDVGTGLYVPVIRNAAALDLVQISARLMSFRTQAMRRSVRAEDLNGGRITIALHMDRDLLLAVPIVFPGQVCTISVGGVQDELRLDDDGGVITGRYLNIGIAYDHRIVNGREAVSFLTAIKTRLESPDDRDA